MDLGLIYKPHRKLATSSDGVSAMQSTYCFISAVYFPPVRSFFFVNADHSPFSIPQRRKDVSELINWRARAARTNNDSVRIN